MLNDKDALHQRLSELRRLQRSRPVPDTEIAELLDSHLGRPSGPEEIALIRTYLRRGPTIATFKGFVQMSKSLRETLRLLVLDGEGSTTIPRWGSWREFTTLPELTGEPPKKMTKVDLTRGGLDLLEAIPARARRRTDPTSKIAIYLHLGQPANPDDPYTLTVVMGDHRIGTVDLSDEPGLSQLATETAQNDQMLALQGYLILSTPPRAFIELYYR